MRFRPSVRLAVCTCVLDGSLTRSRLALVVRGKGLNGSFDLLEVTAAKITCDGERGRERAGILEWAAAAAIISLTCT